MWYGAWKKMEPYTRFMVVLDLLIPLFILNGFSAAFYWDPEGGSGYIASGIIGHIMGTIVAAPVWGICHTIFNVTYRKAARKHMKKQKSLTHMQEVMVEFWGITNGFFWMDDAWNEYGRMYADAPYGQGVYSSFRGGFSGFSSGGSSGFGGFGGGSFGGGGAGASW